MGNICWIIIGWLLICRGSFFCTALQIQHANGHFLQKDHSRSLLLGRKQLQFSENASFPSTVCCLVPLISPTGCCPSNLTSFDVLPFAMLPGENETA